MLANGKLPSKESPMPTLSADEVKEYITGTSNTTKTFATPRRSMLISNDGTADMTISLNGLIFTVKPTEVLDERFADFQMMTVFATTAYRIWVRG